MIKVAIFVLKALGVIFGVGVPLLLVIIFASDEQLYAETAIYRYLSHPKIEVLVSEEAISENQTSTSFIIKHIGGSNISPIHVKIQSPAESQQEQKFSDVEIEQLDGNNISVSEESVSFKNDLLVEGDFIKGKFSRNPNAKLLFILHDDKQSIKHATKLRESGQSLVQQITHYLDNEGEEVVRGLFKFVFYIILALIAYLILSIILKAYKAVYAHSGEATKKNIESFIDKVVSFGNKVGGLNENQTTALFLGIVVLAPFLITTVITFSLVDYIILFVLLTRGRAIFSALDSLLSLASVKKLPEKSSTAGKPRATKKAVRKKAVRKKAAVKTT